jgi:hypothetical protein
MAAAQRSDAGARTLQQSGRTKAAVTTVWTPRQIAATAGTAEGGGTAMRCGSKAAPAALANQGGNHDIEDAEAQSRHSRHSRHS